MGTVYRARDLFFGDFVALKLLRNQSSDAGDGARFGREAQLLSELCHLGIVAYVAHGQTVQGQRFLARQWLEGETFAERLARGPLVLSDALLLIRRVAEALGFAHRQGVLHRGLQASCCRGYGKLAPPSKKPTSRSAPG